MLATPASAGVRSFFSPTIEGIPVAACLSPEDGCGKPAADAFCRQVGYDRSVMFERQPTAATRNLQGGAACSGPDCTSFKQVKCFSVKDDLAALGG